MTKRTLSKTLTEPVEPKNKTERDAFRRTARWQIFRGLICSQRNNTCELCGKRYENATHLNVHHRYVTQYTNLNPERFMVVCRLCHDFIHIKFKAPNFAPKGWYGLVDRTGPAK